MFESISNVREHARGKLKGLITITEITSRRRRDRYRMRYVYVNSCDGCSATDQRLGVRLLNGSRGGRGHKRNSCLKIAE